MLGVIATACLSCAADDDPELSARILSVTFEVDRDQPDAVANVDISVELLSAVDPAMVRVSDVAAYTLPRGSGSQEYGFTPRLLGPQGENASVAVGADETLVVRVLNGSATNAELTDLCGRSVAVEVAFEAGSLTAEDSSDVNVRCP